MYPNEDIGDLLLPETIDRIRRLERRPYVVPGAYKKGRRNATDIRESCVMHFRPGSSAVNSIYNHQFMLFSTLV